MDSSDRSTPETPHARRAPASSAQQRLWFLDRFEGGRGTEYNVPMLLRLGGPLDTGALRRAIAAIVHRHDTLRTRFEEQHGRPVQVIEPRLDLDLPIVDLTGAAEAAQLAAIDAALDQEWSRPFDLARGPLVRFRLVRLADQDHVLMRTCHHIICDARSQRNFNRELGAIYDAFQAGRPMPLRPLAWQYADYAGWQRDWMHGPDLPRSLEPWRRALAGAPNWLALPTDRPRTATAPRTAHTHRMVVEGDAVAALRRLCRAEGTTMFMTTLAAFGVVLGRYSGQTDMVVVSAMASRDTRLDDLIGLFLNQLPYRLRVDPRQSFRALLQDVRATTLDAFAHQDVPFDRIVEALVPRRSAHVPPWLQVAFAFQNAPPPQSMRPAAASVTMTIMPATLRRVRGDLEVQVQERDGALAISWVYQPALFDAWRIEQMAGHFARALHQVAANPEQMVGRIDLLDPRERPRQPPAAAYVDRAS